MCRATQSLRRAARRPGKTVEMKVIKAEMKAKVAKMESAEIRRCNSFSERKRPPMDSVVKKLGQKDLKKQEWLVLTPRDQMPRPEKEFFPRPPKRDDGSYIYDRVPVSCESDQWLKGGCSKRPKKCC